MDLSKRIAKTQAHLAYSALMCLDQGQLEVFQPDGKFRIYAMHKLILGVFNCFETIQLRFGSLPYLPFAAMEATIPIKDCILYSDEEVTDAYYARFLDDLAPVFRNSAIEIITAAKNNGIYEDGNKSLPADFVRDEISRCLGAEKQ